MSTTKHSDQSWAIKAVKKTFITATAASLIAGMGVILADQADASAALITTSNATLRATASDDATAVVEIPSGSTVIGYETTSNGWQKVSFGNKTGYVKKSYLKAALQAAPSKPATVVERTLVNDAQVQTGPGKEYRVVATLKKDTKIATTGRISDTYTEVEYNNDRFWVETNKLNPIQPKNSEKPAPVKPATPAPAPASAKPATPAPVKPATTSPAPAKPATPAPTPVKPQPAKPAPKPSSNRPQEMRTTDWMNVRFEPSLNSRVKLVVPPGTIVTTTGVTSGIFSQVYYLNEKLWIATDWLAKLDPNLPKPFQPSNYFHKLTPADQRARAKQAVAFALKQLGKPYIWGGTGPRGFDCSGLTYASWLSAGYTIPRGAEPQGYSSGFKRIPFNELEPGDLIVVNGGAHVVMYIGNDQIIEAATFNVPIRITRLSTRHFRDAIAVRPGA